MANPRRWQRTEHWQLNATRALSRTYVFVLVRCELSEVRIGVEKQVDQLGHAGLL